MDLRNRIDSMEGLTNLSAWHNGDHWVCAAQLRDSFVEVGHGDTATSAMLAAMAGAEAHRGQDAVTRHPELAGRFAVLKPKQAPAPDPFDGY